MMMRTIQKLTLTMLAVGLAATSSYGLRKEALVINRSRNTEDPIDFYYNSILLKKTEKLIYPGDTLHVVFDENSFDQIMVRIAIDERKMLKKPVVLVWPGDVVFVQSNNAADTYTFSGKQLVELRLYEKIWRNPISLDNWYQSRIGNMPRTLEEFMCEWQAARQATDALIAELRRLPGIRPAVAAVLTRELRLETLRFLLRGNEYHELYYPTAPFVPSSLRKYKLPGTVKVFPVVYQDSVLAQFRRLQVTQVLPTSASWARMGALLGFAEYAALTQKRTASASAQYAVAKREYEGALREWVCYWLLYEAKIFHKPLPLLVKDYRSWMMPESRFVRSLTGQDQLTLVMPDQLLANTDTLIGVDQEKLTLAQLLARHRGSVIYLDFWASWCGPCVWDMPASAALRQHYRGKKVIFLYLSIDEDHQKWQRAQTQMLPHVPEQYRFASTKTSRFLKRFAVNSIPRYILVDTYGILRYAEAPHPNDPELKARVTTLLAR